MKSMTPEPEPSRREIYFREILAEQRLAAGETDEQTAEGGGLLEEPLYRRGVKLLRAGFRVAGRQTYAAVETVKITPLGEFDVEPGEGRLAPGPEAPVARRDPSGVRPGSAHRANPSSLEHISPLLSKWRS